MLHLYDSLKQGISDRERTEELLSKQISDEFAIVQERLAQEKSLREAQEEQMLGAMADIKAKFQD